MLTAECQICGGTGWRYLEDAEPQGVVPCACVQQRKLERLIELAHLPARYEHCSFENFNPITERLKLVKAAALKFVEEYPLVDCGLLILGPCGVGKTHLAVSILREIIQKVGARGLFCDFRELLKRIQNSYNPVSQSSELEILEPVLNSDLLVLDDLGAERPTEWVRETVSYIINSRYNRRLTTIITTNFDDQLREPKTLSNGTVLSKEESLEDRIGTRLRSRLYEMCKVIRIEGFDFRLKVKQAQYQY
ncbi:MAG: ATP-binding protein [Terriglobia bacterium]